MTTITSRQNPAIKYLKKLAADGAFRRQEGLYLCDGVKLLEDALRSGAPIQTVLTAKGVLPESQNCQLSIVNCQLFVTSREIADSVSPSRSPQGVVFTVRLPAPLPTPPEKGKYLLLDSLQDPGNVGSILRTAEAFGLSGVYLTPGCADPYGPKALRAGMGAQFRLPIGFCAGTGLPGGKLPVYAAAAREGAAPVASLCGKDCVVMLGSEGGGLSETLLAGADGIVAIPMPGGAESLGVAAAAAVVCYCMAETPAGCDRRGF